MGPRVYPTETSPKAISKVTRVVTFETLQYDVAQLENQQGNMPNLYVNTLRLAGVENDAYFNNSFSQKVPIKNILTVLIVLLEVRLSRLIKFN